MADHVQDPENWVVPVAPEPSPEEPDTDRPHMNKITGIRYVGLSDRRVLSTEDLSMLGVSSPKTDERLVWSPVNGKTVDISKVNAETLDALLATGEFEVVSD